MTTNDMAAEILCLRANLERAARSAKTERWRLNREIVVWKCVALVSALAFLVSVL